MRFKEIQEMIYNHQLNEDFLDDFAPDTKKETAGQIVARMSDVENNSTFRLTVSAKVNSAQVIGADEINYKSHLSYIEECVKNFDALGQNTSDMTLRLIVSPPMSF